MVEWFTSPQVPGPSWAVWWRKDTLRSWACGLWLHWAKTWAKKKPPGSAKLNFWHMFTANTLSFCQPSQLMSFMPPQVQDLKKNLSFPGDFPAFGTPMMPISVRRVRRVRRLGSWSGFNRLRRILNVAACGALWKTVKKRIVSLSHIRLSWRLKLKDAKSLCYRCSQINYYRLKLLKHWEKKVNIPVNTESARGKVPRWFGFERLRWSSVPGRSNGRCLRFSRFSSQRDQPAR